MASLTVLKALSVPLLMFLFPWIISHNHFFHASSNAGKLSLHLLGGLLYYSTSSLLPTPTYICFLFSFSRIPLPAFCPTGMYPEALIHNRIWKPLCFGGLCLPLCIRYLWRANLGHFDDNISGNDPGLKREYLKKYTFLNLSNHNTRNSTHLPYRQAASVSSVLSPKIPYWWQNIKGSV